jgi:hypothetical protein
LEWDEGIPDWAEEMLQPQEINIRTPNVAVTIRQSTPIRANVNDPFARNPRLGRSPLEVARQRDVLEWLQTSPLQGDHGPGAAGLDPVLTPIITRHGRVSKPPNRYDAAAESQIQRDTQEALNISKPLKRLKSPNTPKPVNKPAQSANDDNPFARKSKLGKSPTRTATAAPANVSAEKSKATTVKPPTNVSAEKPKTAPTVKTITAKSKVIVTTDKPRVDSATSRKTVAPSTVKAPGAANTADQAPTVITAGNPSAQRSTKTARTPPKSNQEPEDKSNWD